MSKGVDGHGSKYTDTPIPWIYEQRLGWHHRFAHPNTTLSLFDDVLHTLYF